MVVSENKGTQVPLILRNPHIGDLIFRSFQGSGRSLRSSRRAQQATVAVYEK